MLKGFNTKVHTCNRCDRASEHTGPPMNRINLLKPMRREKSSRTKPSGSIIAGEITAQSPCAKIHHEYFQLIFSHYLYFVYYEKDQFLFLLFNIRICTSIKFFCFPNSFVKQSNLSNSY